jgi:hypothetical protein
MKTLCALLLLSVGAYAASPAAPAKKTDADSVRVLRIDAQIPGSWDLDGWFRDELESSLNGFHQFKVIPHGKIDAFMEHAQIEPMRRDSAAEAMLETHFAAPYHMVLRIEAPVQTAHRTTVLFFIGQRTVKMDATVHLFATDARIPELQGDFSVDTTVSMGYCGLIDCQVDPFDTPTRIQIERELFRRLEAKIKGRIEELMVIPAEFKAHRDSLRVDAVRDSLKTKAKQDSLKGLSSENAKAAKPDSAKADTMKKASPAK